MKTKLKMAIGLAAFCLPAYGQIADSSGRKNEKVSIRIIREKEGRETVFDTSFVMNGSEVETNTSDRSIVIRESRNVRSFNGSGNHIFIGKRGNDSSNDEKEIEIIMDKRRNHGFAIYVSDSDSGTESGREAFVYKFMDEPVWKEEELTGIIQESTIRMEKGSKNVHQIEICDRKLKRKKHSEKGRKKIIIIEEK